MALTKISWNALAEGLVVLLGIFCLFQANLGPTIEFDIWYHIRMGEEILRTGVIPHNEAFLAVAEHFPQAYRWNDEWGFGCCMALVYDHLGYAGLAYALSALIALQGVLLYLGGRVVGLSPLPAWALAAFGLYCERTRFMLRPQLMGDCCLTTEIILLFLARTRPRLRWALLPVFVIWTLLHASVVLGLIVLLGWVLMDHLQKATCPAVAQLDPGIDWPQMKRDALLLFLSCIAACCRPIGLYIFVFVGEHFRDSLKLDWILEWWPLTRLLPTWYRDWPMAYLILFGLGLVVAWRRRRLYLIIPAEVLGLLFLTFSHNRQVGELVAGGIPLIAWGFADLPWLRRQSALLTAALAVGMGCYLGTLGPVEEFSPPNYVYPVGALPLLESHLGGPIFCSYQFGSFLVLHDLPVFQHSMCDFFSNEVIEAYWYLRDHPEALAQYCQTYNLGGFVLHYEYFDDQKRLIAALDASPDWALVYWDDVCVVYLPRRLKLTEYRATNPAFPERLQAQPQQAEQELGRYLKLYPDSRKGLKCLARLYSTEKNPLAQPSWDRLVAAAPGDAEGWAGRGQWRFSLGDVAGAVSDLRQSVKLEPNSGLTQFNLAIALLKSGNRQEGEEALRAVRRLAPDFQPAQELSRQLGI